MSIYDNIIPLINNEISFMGDPNGAKRNYLSVKDFTSQIPNLTWATNVKDHGATGDGVTDDTVAMNDAFNQGGTVVIPDGTYIINGDSENYNGLTGGIEVASNTHIILSPNAVLKRKASSSAYGTILRLHSVSNVFIEGGTIDGNRSNFSGVIGSGEWNYDIGVFGGNNINISQMLLKNSYGDGLLFERGHDDSTPTNIRIRDVICDNNRRNGCSIIDIASAEFNGCVFENTNGTAPQAGMDIEPGEVTRLVSDVTISNCRFVGNTGRGLIIEGDTVYVKGVIANQCVFKDNLAAGISGYLCSFPVIITNSVVEGNNASAIDDGGISLIQCINSILSNNVVMDNTYSGIVILGAGNGDLISNNQCLNNTRHGIFAASSGHSILANYCSNNQQNGIYGYDLTDSLIASNYCFANSQATDAAYDGVRLSNISTHNFIHGNICRRGAGVKQQGYGINIGVSGGRSNMVASNDLLTGGKTGAFNDADSNTVVQGNRVS